MKRILALTLTSLAVAALSQRLAAQHASAALSHAASAGKEHAASIPLDQIGAMAEKQYSGDGLSLFANEEGARLRCVFQNLEGEVTDEGLWVTSTVTNTVNRRFRVMAASVGRTARKAALLPPTGRVEVTNKLARFMRPELIEEYSVSMDGVRQDFLLLEKPLGEGALRIELKLSGATAEALPDGARLILEGGGRKLDYHRLRAIDATGRELAARMEVLSATRLTVVVEDGGAVYPVRIDPTFSDANWISMGGILGVDSAVRAVVVDEPGNLYVGGGFRIAGGVMATNIAKWNGSNWSALGSGINGIVNALVVSGGEIYAGGRFTTAGGIAATNIAKWNGSSWSPVGSGIRSIDGENPVVIALATSASSVYAGGYFTMAGGVPATNIAKWNGSSWAVLVSGMRSTDGGPYVSALAMFGNDLYVGGNFTNAGGVATANIAKWNGSNWSALGSGMGSAVRSLAVSGSDLYAGGYFLTAGGKVSGRVARARIGIVGKSLVAVSNSTASIEFSGVTGYEYDVQRATNLNPPISWTTVTASPLSPAADGSFTFSDTGAPPGMAYYRAVER